MSFGSISYIQEHLHVSQSKSKPAGPPQEKPDQDISQRSHQMFLSATDHIGDYFLIDYNGAELKTINEPKRQRNKQINKHRQQYECYQGKGGWER